MSKMLDAREKEEKILQLNNGELDVKQNVLDHWPTKKVNRVMTDTRKGIKINLFDVSTNKITKTVMRRVADEEFHISWDFERQGHMVGDEILMRWDWNDDWLAYRVLPTSPLRTYPQIANHFSSSFRPVQ